MEVIERGLTWARLRPHLPDLGPSDLLVLEANLAPALAAALLGRFGGRTRVVFEGVSVEKLQRHAGSLRDLFLLSTNEEELAAARAGGGREWARSFLAERRIGHWLIGRGRNGARLLEREQDGRVRSRTFPPARVVRAADTTGAGDRLLAGVLARLDRAGSVERALPGAMREVEKAIEEGKL
jgi:sugar/nucleoside kinase (ribokinase family)